MDMDIPKLAADITKFLAPLLPFLIQGAKDAARAAFERAGEKFIDEVCLNPSRREAGIF